MPKLDITVGNEEKHNIRVEGSIWTGKFAVYIDEKEMAKAHGKLKDEVLLTIGNKEKHELKVTSEGLLAPRIKVFLDSKLIATT